MIAAIDRILHTNRHCRSLKAHMCTVVVCAWLFPNRVVLANLLLCDSLITACFLSSCKMWMCTWVCSMLALTYFNYISTWTSKGKGRELSCCWVYHKLSAALQCKVIITTCCSQLQEGVLSQTIEGIDFIIQGRDVRISPAPCCYENISTWYT